VSVICFGLDAGRTCWTLLQKDEPSEEDGERITIRLSREVVARFRATGDGWQSRVDAALQDWLDKNPRSSVQ
jgi:uncharacterized protein (DUF4415 family)